MALVNLPPSPLFRFFAYCLIFGKYIDETGTKDAGRANLGSRWAPTKTGIDRIQNGKV